MSNQGRYAVRGGSWVSAQRYVRCAYRLWPGVFLNGLGFRVVHTKQSNKRAHSSYPWYGISQGCSFVGRWNYSRDHYNLSIGFRVIKQKSTQ